MKKLLFLVIFSVIFMASTAATELNPLLQSSAKYNSIIVKKAFTVDSLLLDGGGKVCLIGITGPNPPKFRDVKRDEHGFIIPDDDPTTPFEVEALRFVKFLTENKTVRLEFDAQRRADDGCLQAYVILPDGMMLNEELLRRGYAQLALRMPNIKYAERFRTAYKEARKEMRGMQGNW